MELAAIAFLVCILLIVATYINQRRKNLPPGPYGVPLLGYTPFLGKNAIQTMTNLKRKYGNVVSITLGMKSVVILNDWHAVKEAFVKQGVNFSGRPQLFWQKQIFSDTGLLFADGLTWKEQRHFSLKVLQDFGFGRSSMESRIIYEIDQLTDQLNDKAGTPIDVTGLFISPVLNIIWNITAGKRFDDADEFLTHIKRLSRVLMTPGTFSPLNSFPIIRFLNPKWKQIYNQFSTGLQKLQDYLERELSQHENNFKENNLNDFIDVYLDEIYKRREKNGKEVPPYTRNHLLTTILELFLAGEEATTATLCWAFLYMANYPSIQRKVQNELDGIVATDSYLSFSSKSLAPYTEATLLEIQRRASTAPLAIPRVVTKATTLLGYEIPNETMVYANTFGVHHDERYWGDAYNFRPERFIDETENNVIRHECFMPFSVGSRSCMGDSLAKMELHLFFTSLLRRFTFETIPGEAKPSMEPVPGSLFKTKPFYLNVKPR